MTWLVRALLLAAAAASAGAAWTSARALRGDLILFGIPPADRRTNYRQAYFYQETLRKGLELHPLAWEGLVHEAEFFAVQRKFPEALDRLIAARRYYTAIRGLSLEASIYAEREVKRDADAIELFEMLRRVSILDRGVVQNLLKLYSRTQNLDKLRDLATEVDMRWWYAFDTQVALGNCALARNDVPLTFKYFLLAWAAPRDSYARPNPHAFEMSDIESRIPQASEILLYDSDWARWSAEDVREEP